MLAINALCTKTCCLSIINEKCIECVCVLVGDEGNGEKQAKKRHEMLFLLQTSYFIEHKIMKTEGKQAENQNEINVRVCVCVFQRFNEITRWERCSTIINMCQIRSHESLKEHVAAYEPKLEQFHAEFNKCWQ